MQTGPFTNRQGGRQLKYCLVSIDILHGQLVVCFPLVHDMLALSWGLALAAGLMCTTIRVAKCGVLTPTQAAI